MEEGVGLDMDGKEGARSPIPKISTKTFSPYYSQPELNLNERIT
jgi:hypothetical protein